MICVRCVLKTTVFAAEGNSGGSMVSAGDTIVLVQILQSFQSAAFNILLVLLHVEGFKGAFV